MGWVHQEPESDVEHEAYIEMELVDGAVSAGGAKALAEGVMVPIEGDERGGETIWRPAGEVVGWRIRCHCRVNGKTSGSWSSRERWTRVPSSTLEDVADWKLFAPDEHTPYVGERSDVESVALSVWQREHLAGLSADDDVRAALELHKATAVAVDVAVARARRAGRTWKQIGAAGSMTAPAANSRWKDRVAAVDELLAAAERAEPIIAGISPASADQASVTAAAQMNATAEDFLAKMRLGMQSLREIIAAEQQQR